MRGGEGGGCVVVIRLLGQGWGFKEAEFLGVNPIAGRRWKMAVGPNGGLPRQADGQDKYCSTKNSSRSSSHREDRAIPPSRGPPGSVAERVWLAVGCTGRQVLGPVRAELWASVGLAR
jgi:hypothetical protein